MIFIAYPNHIPALGGPIYVRHNAYSAWVHFPDSVVRLPLRLVADALNNGLATGEIARQYRSAKAPKVPRERCVIHGFSDDGDMAKPCPACIS